ncbi:hypothetical protein LCGC14_1132520 [marine sediment metagenome]|uniref:Uncharacterized protein n=1 Tax=marine sediment metagenome TaxID=412755 RepID=A0A0F9MNI6_9ZZZZ
MLALKLLGWLFAITYITITVAYVVSIIFFGGGSVVSFNGEPPWPVP